MRRKFHAVFIALCCAIAVSLIMGCATTGALVCRPDPLEHPEMRYDDAANSAAIAEHVYVSKEASRGAQAVSGGGCGCN